MKRNYWENAVKEGFPIRYLLESFWRLSSSIFLCFLVEIFLQNSENRSNLYDYAFNIVKGNIYEKI